MEPIVAGGIGFAIMIILLFLGMPIGLCMIAVGFVGMVLLTGWGGGSSLLGTIPYLTWASYDMSVTPLFLLMGTFWFYSGMSEDLYSSAYKWLGHLPGGLGMATVGAAAVFSAVSGSVTASSATFTKVCLPEMKRHNYDMALATGCIAAGATLDPLIPPGLSMIIYAILTEQSIGKLFIAGIFPGIILTFFYMATIYIMCKRNPHLGPRGPKTTWWIKFTSLKATWPAVILFLVVIGGIYLGVFTATEAAGIGACGAFILGTAMRRLKWQGFTKSLMDTGKLTAMVFILLLGARIFNYFLAVTQFPTQVATIIGMLEVNRYLVLASMIVVYIILGAIMDELAMILLTIPIFYPIILGLGFDPIWFGIIIVMMSVFGLIAPPVGMVVFVIKGVAPDIPISTIYRGAAPFFIPATVLVVLLVAFPQIATWLPDLMK